MDRSPHSMPQLRAELFPMKWPESQTVQLMKGSHSRGKGSSLLFPLCHRPTLQDAGLSTSGIFCRWVTIEWKWESGRTWKQRVNTCPYSQMPILLIFFCFFVNVLIHILVKDRCVSFLYHSQKRKNSNVWQCTLCLFQLNVDPSGPALDLEVPLEIIIGTIPLRQVVEQFPPHPASIQPPPPAGYSAPPGTMYPPPEGASAPYPPLDPSAPTAPFMPPSSISNLRE